MLERNIVATDVNPYAVLLTKAKLHPPYTLEGALEKADFCLKQSERLSGQIAWQEIPRWVRSFFHPRTLREILALVEVLRYERQSFLLACLLGILHHQRPGFLSYPASHLVPYLRTRNFPKERYPELYEYRPIRPRLFAKIQRIYKRFPTIDPRLFKKCLRRDVAHLRLPKGSLDAVITSPPYMNALDYGRDNRLRLWFLGVRQTQRYDKRTDSQQRFLLLMERCLSTLRYSLKKNGSCVLVIGEVGRSRRPVNAAKLVMDIAVNKLGGFHQQEIIEDVIPDIRRARREGKSTKKEWIIVLTRR